MTPSADEDAEQLERHTLRMEIQNGTATLQDGLTVSHKVKHTLTM